MRYEGNYYFPTYGAYLPGSTFGLDYEYETNYRELKEVKSPAKRFWHEQAMVPWVWNPQTRVFISYDDPQSLRAKAAYAKEKKLGGVMFWELEHDDEQSSLLNALHEGLRE